MRFVCEKCAQLCSKSISTHHVLPEHEVSIFCVLHGESRFQSSVPHRLSCHRSPVVYTVLLNECISNAIPSKPATKSWERCFQLQITATEIHSVRTLFSIYFKIQLDDTVWLIACKNAWKYKLSFIKFLNNLFTS